MLMTSMPTKPPPTVGFLLHDVARLLRKRFEQNARDTGLTRSQWQVLAYLDRNAGIQQGALAELIDVEPITVGRIVDKLESCGLAERRAHPTDRRSWQLYLTEKAGPTLEKMRVLGEITRAEAFGAIPEAERARLLGLLETMKENLVAACQSPAAEGQARHG
ncbi:MarR family winged helix-turn-helix transcriptional regulator [Bosea sp. F3-2]|uniref:MarR family winged helix-turn-helix transcriptional regulator n=1 Tax=Bosea sp. F3-2 TaxID=2599640 RepID=UPI0020BDBBFE|nr:MarR family winged helix-turn-helix transcriptional regulator [Bosea sp. F3-2]